MVPGSVRGKTKTVDGKCSIQPTLAMASKHIKEDWGTLRLLRALLYDDDDDDDDDADDGDDDDDDDNK